MKDDSMKWIMIALMVAIAGPMIALAISSIFENQARAKILTACYQSNRMDCVAEYRAIMKVEEE